MDRVVIELGGHCILTAVRRRLGEIAHLLVETSSGGEELLEEGALLEQFAEEHPLRALRAADGRLDGGSGSVVMVERRGGRTEWRIVGGGGGAREDPL